MVSLQDSTPVPIIQDEWEFGLLLDLYCERLPRNVLEVGTYTGGTLFHWLRCASSETHVLSVDLYEDADNRHLYDEWCAPGASWSVVVGNSNDKKTAKEVRSYAPFDWIFIDAGHFNHEIRADVKNYLPMVKEGGIVAFHDVRQVAGIPNIQVFGVWNELRATHRTIEIANAGGVGIGVLFA